MKYVLLMFLTGLVLSKNITKREGETVFLIVNVSRTDYLWTYGPQAPTKALAVVVDGVLTLVKGTRFDSRLRFNISSGSIAISNLTISDTGTFLMQILTKARKVETFFNLTVRDNGVVIQVLKGSNVKMTTRINQLNSNYHVFWTEKDLDGKQIAVWENNISTYDPEQRDNLLIDPQSGSLTIFNVQESKCYWVKIMYGTYPHSLHSLIQFQVHVYSAVPVPHLCTKEKSLSQGPGPGPGPGPGSWSCRVNCSVLNSDCVSLSWISGDKVLNQTKVSNSSGLVLTLDVPLSSREDSFICKAENPVSNQTVFFNATMWCPLQEEDFSWKIWLGVGCIVLCFILAVIIYTARKCQRNNQFQRPNNCMNLETIDRTEQDSERDLLRSTNAANYM